MVAIAIPRARHSRDDLLVLLPGSRTTPTHDIKSAENPLDRIQEMSIFVAVSADRNFAAAARKLKVSAPTVTRAVAELERRLGVLLVVRDSRRLRLTEAGIRFAEDARRVLQELQEAEESAAGIHANPRGLLAITAPMLFGELHVTPVLNAYLDAHPEVQIRALLVDRKVSLLDEGVDVAIRIGALPDSTMTAVPVGTVRRVVCASPAYLDEFGRPTTPSELPARATVSADATDQDGQWRFRVGSETRAFAVRSRLTVTSFPSAIRAAVLGAGLTQVASYQVAAQVAKGELKLVLEDFEVAPLPVHVLYVEGRRGSGKVRSFVDACVPMLRKSLLEHIRTLSEAAIVG